MEVRFLLLLLCHLSYTERHLLTVCLTGSSGLPGFPEVEVSLEYGGTQVGHCDENRIQVKQDALKQLLGEHPEMLEWFSQQCVHILPHLFRERISALKDGFKQPEGVHIFQRIDSCEFDDETEEIVASTQYGYNGEDFLSLDLKAMTWIALKHQALPTKLAWDTNKPRMNFYKSLLTSRYPTWLKGFLRYNKRTDPPSVSLLQRSPSSPVSCLATGFYPDRAVMLWRRDGEKLQEFVRYGEILPNNDGSFQMTVDLNISSMNPEDWRRFDCEFQLSGLEVKIIRLNEEDIKTNWGDPAIIRAPTAAPVLTVAAVLIAAAGFVAYRKSRENDPPSSPELLDPLRQLKPPT